MGLEYVDWVSVVVSMRVRSGVVGLVSADKKLGIF